MSLLLAILVLASALIAALFVKFKDTLPLLSQMPILGGLLSAPPTSRITSRRIGIMAHMVQKLGLLINGRLPVTWISGLLCVAKFMGDYLKIGASRSAESSHSSTALPLIRITSKAGFATRNLRSRGDITMEQNNRHMFADAATRIVSSVGQIINSRQLSIRI